MQKTDRIKGFFNNNRTELFLVAALFMVFCILMVVFHNYFGHLVIDCGREAYFPLEMLKGKVLYKDIFNIFGPLSYQLNAFFYKIFGVSLDTLRLVGALNALVILSLLYTISRIFTSKLIAWASTLFLIISCAFHPWIFNYIFPYSYAMTYAFSAFLFSVLFLMLYLKTHKSFLIPLSWFFLGVSIASKYEYLLYALFLGVFTLFMKVAKKLKWRYLFYSLVSILIVPIISFSILFLQGLTIPELINQIEIIKKFALSPSLNHFYASAVGLYPKKQNLKWCWFAFKSFFPMFVFLLWSAYFYFKCSAGGKKKIFKLFISLVFVGISLYYLSSNLVGNFSFAFCWLPLFTLLIFCIIAFRVIRNKNYPKDGVYTVFIFISLITSVKSFFYLNLGAYGTFALPLLFLVNSIFVVEYLPEYLKFVNKSYLKKAYTVVVLSLVVLYSGNFLLFYKNGYSLLNTERGAVYNHNSVVTSYQGAIDYINKYMSPSDTFLVMPEGIMLNFLTNHSSKSIYYATNTPYLETFGENKVITDIKKDPPNYIFLNNRNSGDYGPRYMCDDYGFKICDYVKTDYKKVTDFGSGFKMTLYKKN